MKYLEVTIKTTPEGSELVADMLTAMGSSGISIYDAGDLTDVINSDVKCDYVDESFLADASEEAAVCGFFTPDDRMEKIRDVYAKLEGLIKRAECDLGSLNVSYRIIDDAEWYENWKKFYKPIKIKGITIVPEWCPPPKVVKGFVVWLNPGIAFGTGEHETTKGCIELIQLLYKNKKLSGKSVIDLGCGSGILGLTASVYDVKRVTMIDLDPVAVSAAKENVIINKREDKVTVIHGNLFKDNEIKADIILANLTCDLLMNNAEEIKKHLNKKGKLILSGIIKERCDEVIAVYEGLGFSLDKNLEKGEWNALLLSLKE